MRRFLFCILIALGGGLLLGSPANGDGVVNDGAKTWRVAYQKAEKHKRTEDVALRLRVETTGNNLTGTLTRYDRTEESSTTGSEVYRKRNGPGGKIALAGAIVSAGGGTTQRKPEKFILTGYYVDDDGLHQITIRGYHTVGKNKADRIDDQVCIRIRMRDFGSHDFAPAPEHARAPGMAPDPCDEQPPDEDVMNEEPPPSNPNEDPYDGG